MSLLLNSVNPLFCWAGAYLFQALLWEGLIEIGGLFEGWGGLFNLEKAMVSVLHEELEYKVEKLKNKKFSVMQLTIRIKSELPVGKLTIPDQSTQSFTVMVDYYNRSLIY